MTGGAMIFVVITSEQLLFQIAVEQSEKKKTGLKLHTQLQIGMRIENIKCMIFGDYKQIIPLYSSNNKYTQTHLAMMTLWLCSQWPVYVLFMTAGYTSFNNQFQ